jgi:hypothetical protein
MYCTYMKGMEREMKVMERKINSHRFTRLAIIRTRKMGG